MLRTTLFFLFVLAVRLAGSGLQFVNRIGPPHRELRAEQLPVAAEPPESEQGRNNAGAQGGPDYQTVGVSDYLPVFTDRLSERMTFPLSWLSGHYHDFNSWRNLARPR
jgi:hypothetical protein